MIRSKVFTPGFRPHPKSTTPVKIPKQLNRTPIKTKKRPTGEAALFQAIWASRPHVSFLNGEKLGNEAKASFFMHVLSKGKYPAFRLYDKNIVLGTEDQHYIHHNVPRSKWPAEFKKLIDLEEELKSEYKNRK